jgi:formylmethanofuran dehydrogenase subunit B
MDENTSTIPLNEAMLRPMYLKLLEKKQKLLYQVAELKSLVSQLTLAISSSATKIDDSGIVITDRTIGAISGTGLIFGSVDQIRNRTTVWVTANDAVLEDTLFTETFA